MNKEQQDHIRKQNKLRTKPGEPVRAVEKTAQADESTKSAGRAGGKRKE